MTMKLISFGSGVLLSFVTFVAGWTIERFAIERNIRQGILPEWKSVTAPLFGTTVVCVSLIALLKTDLPIMVGFSAWIFSSLGIVCSFARHKNNLKKRTVTLSVQCSTFCNGTLTEGITPDRDGALCFADTTQGMRSIPLYFIDNSGIIRYGVIEYDKAKKYPTSIHQRGYPPKEFELPFLVRVNTHAEKWGRTPRGIPFIMDGLTGALKGNSLLLCYAEEPTEEGWRAFAENSLILLIEGDMLSITDTSGTSYVIGVTKRTLWLERIHTS